MILECQGLSKMFSTGRGKVTALQDVSFGVKGQEFLSIVGPSGCGKTTLLKIIAGLATPSGGQIVWRDGDSSELPSNALVFQEHALFPWMTVLDNVAFGLEMAGVERRQRSVEAGEFLQKVGLGGFEHNYPHELSVGMRQRANLARAFLTDPDILLMDEPLGSLDAQTKTILQEELLRIWKEYRKLVLYVTHDIREAVLLGDRVLVMTGHPGQVAEDLDVPLSRPRDLTALDRPEVTQLMRHIWNRLETEVRGSL